VPVNEHDRPYVTGTLLTQLDLALSAAGWRERLAQMEAAGATEVAYQPAGPDIACELEAFITAVRG
jgi:5,10-methylenetetrahydromethanopterin reductase